jgi:hypothetical protein
VFFFVPFVVSCLRGFVVVFADFADFAGFAFQFSDERVYVTLA